MSTPTAEPRVLRSETKRRRLNTPSITSGSTTAALPVPPLLPTSLPTQSFHRKLQGHAVTRLSSLLSRYEFLKLSLTETLASHTSLVAAQAANRQSMTDSLGNVNAVLSLAAALTQSTQSRTAEATQLSSDIQAFVGRWAQYMADLRKQGTDLSPLSRSAEELYAGGGELFEGLFEGIEFDGTKDDSKEWEDVVATINSLEGNSSVIADSYVAVFLLFESQFSDAGSLTTGFRKAVVRIVRTVATVLLRNMVQIEEDLKELNERAAEMRGRNVDLWAIYADLDDKGHEARKKLARILEEVPGVEDKMEDQILQLVILAKGE